MPLRNLDPNPNTLRKYTAEKQLHMAEQMRQRAQMLVEDTQEKIRRQRAIVAEQEEKGCDPRITRQLLQVWEEALVRRIEIRDQIQEAAWERKRRA